MAEDKSFSFTESKATKLNDKDILDQIRFQVSRNNVKENKFKAKKKVINPMSILLMDPIMGTHAWIRKAKYNKKIADGRLDEVTKLEKLEFESKVDPNRGIFEGKFSPENLIPRDTKKEVDILNQMLSKIQDINDKKIIKKILYMILI